MFETWLGVISEQWREGGYVIDFKVGQSFGEPQEPGEDKIQLALFYDYRNNPPLYPAWHKYLREKKPAVLVVWGKNDPVFATAGAEAFLKDTPSAELHLLDTGHFALEEDAAEIAQIIRAFLAKNIR